MIEWVEFRLVPIIAQHHSDYRFIETVSTSTEVLFRSASVCLHARTDEWTREAEQTDQTDGATKCWHKSRIISKTIDSSLFVDDPLLGTSQYRGRSLVLSGVEFCAQTKIIPVHKGDNKGGIVISPIWMPTLSRLYNLCTLLTLFILTIHLMHWSIFILIQKVNTQGII